MLRLKDQVAIVTGGGSGIGSGIAVALAREGVRVVICGRRTASLDETLKIMRQAGSAGLTVLADLSDPADVDHLVNSTLKEYGRIDILINNAGVGGGAQIHLHDTEDWDQVMAINLRGQPGMAHAGLSPLPDPNPRYHEGESGHRHRRQRC